MSRPELTEAELELLDSILRMYPDEEETTLAKVERYIAHEANLSERSSDGKWHQELLADLERLRRKLMGETGVDANWDLIRARLSED